MINPSVRIPQLLVQEQLEALTWAALHHFLASTSSRAHNISKCLFFCTLLWSVRSKGLNDIMFTKHRTVSCGNLLFDNLLPFFHLHHLLWGSTIVLGDGQNLLLSLWEREHCIVVSVTTRNRQCVLDQCRLGIYGAVGSVWGTVHEEREQVEEKYVCVRKPIVQLTYRGFPKSLSSLWMYLKQHPIKCNYIFKM